MVGGASFQVAADKKARRWLDEHPSSELRVLAYDVRRCCGGGRICSVRFRERSRLDDPSRFRPARLQDGTAFLVDARAAARLPDSFTLTTRGVGPLRRLDLDLDGNQWGRLLYD